RRRVSAPARRYTPRRPCRPPPKPAAHARRPFERGSSSSSRPSSCPVWLVPGAWSSLCPLHEETLHALRLRLARVYVAARVGRHVVRSDELSQLVAALAEVPEHLQVCAAEDPDLLVHPVHQIEEALLRV